MTLHVLGQSTSKGNFLISFDECLEKKTTSEYYAILINYWATPLGKEAH